MILQIILLTFLLLFSAFFSGSEIALFSIGEARIRSFVEERRPGARALQKLKARPERLLVTILLVNNVANIAAAAITTAVALDLYGDAGVAYATGLVTFAVLIFGEITPKGLATAN